MVPMSVSARHPDDPVIVDARRSPFGRRNGVLAGVHPHDLLGSVHRAVIEDSAIQGPDIDMIITGCVTQIGDQSYNIGRMAALSGGLTPIIAASLMAWSGATWPISVYLIACACITLTAAITAPETARAELT